MTLMTVVQNQRWMALGLAGVVLALASGPGAGGGIAVLLLLHALPCILWPDVLSRGAGFAGSSGVVPASAFVVFGWTWLLLAGLLAWLS